MAILKSGTSIQSSGTPELKIESTSTSGVDALLTISGAQTASSTADISKISLKNATTSAYTMGEIVGHDPDGAHANGNGELIFRTSSGGVLSDAVSINSSLQTTIHGTLDIEGTGLAGSQLRIGTASTGDVRSYIVPRNSGNTDWDWNSEFGYNVTDGLWYFDSRVIFTDTTDASATTNGAITIGDIAGINQTLDGNEIVARNNGSLSTLNLNPGGTTTATTLNASTMNINGTGIVAKGTSTEYGGAKFSLSGTTLTITTT